MDLTLLAALACRRPADLHEDHFVVPLHVIENSLIVVGRKFVGRAELIRRVRCECDHIELGSEHIDLLRPLLDLLRLLHVHHAKDVPLKRDEHFGIGRRFLDERIHLLHDVRQRQILFQILEREQVDFCRQTKVWRFQLRKLERVANVRLVDDFLTKRQVASRGAPYCVRDVQRVSRAQVNVGNEVVGKIGPGLVVLLGVSKSDAQSDADYLAAKITGLRIFDDQEGKMNLSLADLGGAVLAVSQFTLYGDVRRGKRPSFDDAAAPDLARELYEYFVGKIRESGFICETGRFQAMMQVELVNDGPVTILLDSNRTF